ncbi:MAG: ComF family protein [Bacteroidia bacterium]|nr:ComF family protein [Bacteroidia bacterium]
MRTAVSNVIDLLIPRFCLLCGSAVFEEYEKFLCLGCFSDLPLSMYSDPLENPMSKTLWGRCEFIMAQSLLNYQRHSIYADLFKEIKYRGRKDLAFYMGILLGRKMKKELKHLDCVVLIPVPLARRKFWMRGYNQAEIIANGIAKSTGISVNRIQLTRSVHRKSQTEKSRVERWLNIQSVYRCSKLPERVQNVILVDDVMTTGATLESCVRALNEENNVGVTILTLGFTQKA